MLVRNILLCGSLCIAIGALAGCGKSPEKEKAKATPVSQAPTASHNHEGWWCNEHGVPEGVCGQCSTKLAAQFKAKGDWCKEHDRPESQCFICHPEKEAEFAAQYEAKFGKKPPKPEAEKAHADHDHSKDEKNSDDKKSDDKNAGDKHTEVKKT